MDTARKFLLRRPLVTLLGAVLIVAGAGMAVARTYSGPPWAQQLTQQQSTQQVDPQQELQKVQTYFSAVANNCGTAVLGQTDLSNQSNQQTLDAYSSLVDALQSGQTSHMVQSVRVLLQNCADHPNQGLMNALYHHGLNWVRHYQHEMWLEQKFAAKWSNGKPGKPDKADKPHGNPHALATGGGPGNGGGHGHGYGHSATGS